MARTADTSRHLNTVTARPYSDHPSALLRARAAELKAEIGAGIDELTAVRAELAVRAGDPAAEPVLPDPPEYMTVSGSHLGHFTVDCRCGAHWPSLTLSETRNVLQNLSRTHHGPGRCEHRWPRNNAVSAGPAGVAV